MIRKPAFVVILFLSCTLASAAPPLRIAVPAGSQGLTAARLWTALASEFGSHDATSLQPLIIQDDATALAMLRLRQADLAILDPLAFLACVEDYELLGIIEHYGRPTEAFVLIASMESIIHRTEDLWRARLMLAGPQTALSWAYPLAWTRIAVRNSAQPGDYKPEPLEADSYSGLLKGIALGTADAGFIPEGFFLGVADGVLAARVRVIDMTDAYPLGILVSRTDLGVDRKAVADRLQGLVVEGLGISAPDSHASGLLEELRQFMAKTEAQVVTEP
ncbi:MAG: PhnD/SsuA/transferrin family substrate-binding protein [Spirochaetota bacterium]